MDISRKFAYDQDKADKGVWVDLEDSKFLICSIKNREFKNFLTDRLKPYRDRINSKKAENDHALKQILDDITIEGLARFILLDWKNVKNEGKTVKYSYENAVKFLTDYNDFRVFINECATDLSLFQKDTEEDIKGN